MFRKAILTSVSALAMISAPAFADDFDFASTLSGQYTHVDLSDLPNAETWGLNGAGKIGLGDTGLNAELDAGYNHLTVLHGHANDWNIGGALFYKNDMGRIGANVNYTKVDVSFFDAHATNYGGFAEFYASDMFTFNAKVGGFSGDIDGVYAGGGVTGYVFPDFGVTASLNYNHINHGFDETDLSLQGEYLLSEEIPVSGFVGYTYSGLSEGAGYGNTLFVGLRLYTNTTGAATLVDRQRSGTVGSLTGFGPLGLNY